MTLAVAVCYPPDVLRNFEQFWGGKFVVERAVILAADSLYSDEQRRPTDDHGFKLVQLAKNVGAVFAGDVSYTRKAIDEFTCMMPSLGTTLDFDQFGRYAQSYFDAEVPMDVDSACLFGIIDKNSEPRILKLSSLDRFIPYYSHSREMIGGNKAASDMFDRLLSDPSRLGGPSGKPGEMGVRVAEALDSTIKKHYPRVAGSVQIAMITKDHFLSGRVIEIGGATEIKEISLRPDETHQIGP